MYKHLNRIIWALCCLYFSLSLSAQKRNYIFYRDSESGKDTIVRNITFLPSDDWNKQFGVKISINDGREVQTLTPKQIYGYRWDDVTYISSNVQAWNEPVFLKRIWNNDSISIYYFFNKKEDCYYVREGAEKAMRRITEDYNPLKQLLSGFDIAQKDKRVAAYIRKMKPTFDAFEKGYKVCSSGNVNYLTRFKWGVLGGVGMASATYGEFDFDSHTQWLAGIFADFPLSGGLSVHPELQLRNYALLDRPESYLSSSAIYNRKMLVIPLMLRYTVVPIKGKCLPYAQAGFDFGYGLKGEFQSQWIAKLHHGEEWISWKIEEPVKLNKFNVSFTVGVGLEVKLNTAHSLFIDARYCRELTTGMGDHHCLSAFWGVLSFNI